MPLYRFMKFNIGEHSWDWTTFILNRKRNDLRIRKYPNTIAVSTAVLLDLIKHGTRNVIVRVGGIAAFKISPKDWLDKAIIDKLTPEQDPHAFLDIRQFKVIKRIPPIGIKPRQEEDSLLINYLGDINHEV